MSLLVKPLEGHDNAEFARVRLKWFGLFVNEVAAQRFECMEDNQLLQEVGRINDPTASACATLSEGG